MSNVIEVDDINALKDLIDTEGDVVVDFAAPDWCIPCQRFAPHFDSASEKSEATFVAVDVDKVPDVTVEYGVRGVPTVMLFRNGEYVVNLQERTVIKLLGELNNA